MKKTIYAISFLMFLALAIPKANASHLMGGEITWTCVGQDSFLIKLVVYTDCNGISLSTTPIYFKCATSGASLTSINPSVGTPVDITPVCKTSCTRCQSLSCSFPYGIYRYTMQSLVSLNNAGNCCSINISWSQSSRNAAITTISGAGSADLYLEALLNRCQNPCDNSPSFTNPPYAILCVGQDFTLNSGTQDIDVDSTGGLLDSLTYEWTPPLIAAGSSCTYMGQYDYDKAIYFWGFPNDALPWPRGIHLDPQTGTLQFRPMKAEVTVMAIKVKEFRHGVKIGEIRRDMEIIVITCTGHKPIITTPGNVRSKNVCVGDTVSYTFSTIDTNSSDSIRLSWNNSIPGATWTDSNGLAIQPSATLTWIPGNNNGSSLPYFFIVTARSNSCPLNLYTSQFYEIRVIPKPLANITVSDSGCGNYWFLAQRVFGSGPSYLWQGQNFNFNPNYYALTQHKFQPGLYPYSMTMTASGCSTTYYDTISIKANSFVSVSLPEDTTICSGTYINISPGIFYYHGQLKYQWSTGDTTAILHFGPAMNDELITLSVEDSTGCSSTDNMQIKIVKSGSVKVSLPADTSVCTGNQVKIEPQIVQNKGKVTYNWSTGDTTEILLTGRIYLDTIISLTVRDSRGCMANDDMKISIDNNGLLKVVLPGDRGICIGTGMAIVPKLIQSKGIVKYLWSNGDTVDILQTGPINSNTTIYLWVQDSTGCMANDNIRLFVLQNPTITQLGNLIICHDSSITLEPAYSFYGSQNYIKSFKWQMAGDTITISTQKYLNVHDSGLYVFLVTDKNGCTGSDMIKVGLLPLVDTTLQVNGSELILTPGMKLYTWYRNDTFDFSTTSNTYVISIKGNYYAILTNYDDCKARTRKVYINPTGINYRNLTGGFVIYPNPTTRKLMLEANEPLTDDLGLLITNMYGGTILNQTFKANDLQTVKEIDISDQPAGTYTVIIRYLNANFHQLIIKE